jgi:hypothetical protein
MGDNLEYAVNASSGSPYLARNINQQYQSDIDEGPSPTASCRMPGSFSAAAWPLSMAAALLPSSPLPGGIMTSRTWCAESASLPAKLFANVSARSFARSSSEPYAKKSDITIPPSVPEARCRRPRMRMAIIIRVSEYSIRLPTPSHRYTRIHRATHQKRASVIRRMRTPPVASPRPLSIVNTRVLLTVAR